MIFSFSILAPFSEDLLQGIMKAAPEDFTMMEQVHGSDIQILERTSQKQIKGDALITQKQGLPIAVKVADCQGVLIFDPITKTIAAIHSGWRGSAQNIIGKTIEKLKELGCRPGDLLLAISPSLGPCCAEFTDPYQELPPSCHPFIQGRKVDFWGLSLAQALAAQVPQNQIEIARQCTKCHPTRYPSHRRGDTERMAVFIGLKY